MQQHVVSFSPTAFPFVWRLNTAAWRTSQKRASSFNLQPTVVLEPDILELASKRRRVDRTHGVLVIDAR